MEQPDGHAHIGKEHLVCKLQKSLYGLKQSPRCWNTAFQEFMEQIHFKQSTTDLCIYVRTADVMTIIAVYVDDLIVITKTGEEMQEESSITQRHGQTTLLFGNTCRTR